MAAGRAGSGADPDRLRSEGASHMPFRGDTRSVTVPASIDGWLALHGRFGRLALAAVLEPAITFASEGFSASLLLVLASSLLTATGTTELCPTGEPLEVDQLVHLPRLAGTLRDLAGHGRDGFYGGEFGRDLLALGGGEFEPSDLVAPLAVWEEPLHRAVDGHTWWTVLPPSQGSLTVASASVAESLSLPTDTADPVFAGLLMDDFDAAGRDRPDVLYDGAEGMELLADARIEAMSRDAGTARAQSSGAPTSAPLDRVRPARRRPAMATPPTFAWATAVGPPRGVLHAPGSPPFHIWDAPTRGVLMESDGPEESGRRRPGVVITRLTNDARS
ncbi:MAG: gamma-glutamyltransferase [Acidimicrobiales bacterium]